MRRPARLALLSGATLLAACTEGGRAAPVEPLDYVLSFPFDSLEIELDAAEGLALRDAPMDQVAETLDGLIDKPAGIRWVTDGGLDAPAPADGWNQDDLAALAEDSLDGPSAPDVLVSHVLLVPGRWAAAPEITLAVSWGHQDVVVFVEAIEEACTEYGDRELGQGKIEQLCSETERVVVSHELGHLIGLVDNGVDQVEAHQDPESAHHDLDEDCVMHRAVGGGAIFQRLHGAVAEEEAPLDFCDACRADLAATQASAAAP